MGIEIERKFLLMDTSWRALVQRTQPMRQAYLGGTHCSTRVRIEGDLAYLNIKSRTLGVQRLEFEYPISVADAEVMIAELAEGAAILKQRHYVPMQNADGVALCFEIDEFAGANAGLVVAEIELPSADTPVPQAAWLGQEVSMDPRYYNLNLVQHPYTRWQQAG
jgi:adenylate cyclase